MELGSVKKWAYGAIAGYFQPKPTTKESYFRDSLRVAGSFERAKKSGNPDFAKEAASRFERLQEKLRTDADPFAYATDLSINLEAYRATGKERYARQARRDADALAVLDVAKPSETEDKLMAASALLKYYELSKEEVYRKKAEELLGGVEVKQSNNKFKKKLAYVAYSDADKLVGGFESEKKLFGLKEAAHIEKDTLGTYLYVAQKLASAFYPVASKAVYAAGGVADKTGDYLERNGLEKTGHGVKFLFGTETLKRTSFGLGAGGVLSIPGLEAIGNVSAGVTSWTGDVNYYEQNGGELSDYHRIVYRGVNTLWGGVGQSTFGPMARITAIPYVGFTMNRRIESAGFGLSGLLAFSFGKVGTSGPGQYARGPFVSLNAGLGLYWVTMTAYSPVLEPLVNWLHPGAAWLRSKNEAMLNYAKGHVKRSGKTTGDAAQPYTDKEIYGTFQFTQTGFTQKKSYHPDYRLSPEGDNAATLRQPLL